jgi:UDP-glucuronate 4-epimerase
MHSVLVTGGAGFIGSHLVDALLARGCSVTVLDNFDPFYPRTIKDQNLSAARTHASCRVVEGDLRNLSELRTALRGSYDTIVHLAAKAGVRPSIEDPFTYQDVNVRGTQHMLELAREWAVPQFVFASSSSVYGVNPRVPWSEEDHVLQPISPYASTKSQRRAARPRLQPSLRDQIHRPSLLHVYGPRQRPDLAISKFARLMLEGRSIPMFGDGSTRRDYTYVEDIISGVLAAIEYTSTPYEVINLGNNDTVTLREMIAGIEEALDIRARVEALPEQPGDVPQTWANVEKAQRLLGYRPTTPYADGVGKFARWLLQGAHDDHGADSVAVYEGRGIGASRDSRHARGRAAGHRRAR